MTLKELYGVLLSWAPTELDELDINFNPMDMSGGNFDDAFWMGIDRGTSETYWKILKFIKDNMEDEGN